MVTADPQGVAWSVELRSSGRVCADIRRGRTALYGAMFLLCDALSVWLLVSGDLRARLVAAGLLAVLGPGLLWAARVVLRVGPWRAPHVLVDAHGVTVRRHDLHVPWADLDGAVGYTANHNRWVTLVVADDRYDAWLASRSWLVRVLGHRRRRRRHGCINLPPNLDVDNVAFGAWLTNETQDRLRTGQSLR